MYKEDIEFFAKNNNIILDKKTIEKINNRMNNNETLNELINNIIADLIEQEGDD